MISFQLSFELNNTFPKALLILSMLCEIYIYHSQGNNLGNVFNVSCENDQLDNCAPSDLDKVCSISKY